MKTVDFSKCNGSVAVIMVHGYKDPHIPWADARVTHDKGWMPKNGCMTTTTPNIDTIHTTITADAAKNIVNEIMCSDADGCATNYPVRWCEHSEGGYDGSTHGWPSDATYKLTGAGHYIWEFWKGL